MSANFAEQRVWNPGNTNEMLRSQSKEVTMQMPVECFQVQKEKAGKFVVTCSRPP